MSVYPSTDKKLIYITFSKYVPLGPGPLLNTTKDAVIATDIKLNWNLYNYLLNSTNNLRNFFILDGDFRVILHSQIPDVIC